MKKLFLSIAILLLAALAACNTDPGGIVNDAATRVADELPGVAETAAAVATDVADGPDGGEPTEEPTEEPTPEPTEEPTATPEPTAIPISGMTGQVVDIDSNEPLVGGQVCIQGTDQCANVDESGVYSLAELDPAEYVFEVTATDYVTATQTISLAAGETLTQDFALTATNPVLAVLPDEAVLRGAVVGIDLVDEASLGVGNTYQFLNDTPWSVGFPEYNIQAGDITLAVAIENGVDFTQIAILVPKLSETELGKAASDALLNSVYSVTAVGESNQSVKPDDFMEVILTDPTSSNPPYTVNFYRGEGETRELVATATIDKQP